MKGLMGATALTALSTGTAFAQTSFTPNSFTPAGETVSNTFTLTYDVNNTPQTEINNNATPTEFNVDRLVNVTVVSSGNTSVVAGEDDALLPFVVVNNGNDDHAYVLTAAQVTGGADDFDSESVDIVYFVDANNNGVLDNGEDAPSELQVYSDATGNLNVPVLAPDERVFVFIRSDIPNPATPLADGSTADLVLTADTQTILTADADGNALTIEDTLGDADGNSSNASEVENVLADEAGATDAAEDGSHSAEGSYIIISPNVTATKEVFGVASAGDGTCTPIASQATYAVPTANADFFTPNNCVEYVIQVNNSGSTEATNIDLADILPENLTFQSAAVRGALTAGTLAPVAADTVCDGTASTCNVVLSDATLASGTSANPTVGFLVIRATIN